MAQEEAECIERTLAVFREVAAYKIPPRMGSGGVKSGDWLVDDKIFTGRLMVVDCGKACELRLTDGNTGELFAVCPVGVGERMTCVEPAADSSRNFVIRVVDPTSKRHAFLGMGFPERGDAFDFNVALADWEKHTQRQEASAASGTAGSAALPAAPQQDFSLKAGETISVKTVKPLGSGGLLSSLGQFSSSAGSGGGSAGGAAMLGLPPPPLPSGSGSGLLPPPPMPAGSSGGFGRPPPPSGGSVSGSSDTASHHNPAAGEEEWTAFA